MFFKKKKDDFELKTEDSYIKYNDDEDFFKYDDEVTQPYVANRNDDELIINKKEQTIIEPSEISDTYYYSDEDEESEVNNTYLYSDSDESQEVNNTYLYSDSDESQEVNNTYVDAQNVNYYEDNNNENDDKDFHLSSKLLYILNKIFGFILVITIIIAIIVLFDVIMLTRFNKGPFFAIRTHMYDDGGTKVYHGIGYKVIKYNVLNGRQDMVVGNYSITYDTNSKDVTLESLGVKFKDDYKNTFNTLVGSYVRVSGTVSSIDTANKSITLKYSDDEKYNVTLKCEDVRGNLKNLKTGDSIKIKGILYVKSNADNIELYLEDGIIDK